MFSKGDTPDTQQEAAPTSHWVTASHESGLTPSVLTELGVADQMTSSQSETRQRESLPV